MKTIKVLGIIAITMIIGFTLAACGDKEELPRLTGTVSIIGTAQVGWGLYADIDSLGGSGKISYQWKRNGTLVNDRIDNYWVQPADVGYTITVTVTRSDNSGSVTSNPTDVVIADPTPVATDFDIGNLTQIAGQVTPVTITPKEGKSTGKITIYYNGSTYLPTAIGTYEVTFDVAAAYGWNAANGLSGGTLTIDARVHAQVPVITVQPVGATLPLNVPHTLSVEASASDGGTLSYQWYSSRYGYDYSLGTEAMSTSYSPPTNTVGSYSYFVEVTNTIPDNGDGGNKTATVRSNSVSISISVSEIVINLTNMNEWALTEQTARAYPNVNKVFTVTGTYTTYRWYLDGTQVGTSSSYTFNKPEGIYELIVVATNSGGESRSGRCWVTVGIPLALTANVWTDGNITDSNGEDWYSFPVSSGTTYYIWWNDKYDKREGSGKTGDVAVSARYENETTFIFGGTNTTVDNGFTTAQSFAATQTGTVYIRVILYNRDSYNSRGSYNIVYSTSSTRPADDTPLTANVWANGSLGSATGEVWYSFPITAGTTYRIWWNDRKDGNYTRTGDIAIGARYVGSSGWFLGGTDATVDSGWMTSQSFTANRTGTVEIRVIPYNRNSSNTGTYGIVYSTDTTRPEL
jgi:hypothetical protein